MAVSNNATTIDFPVEIPTVRKREHWIARAGDVELRLSNLNKVFWPESGYTKGDLLTYYFNVAMAIVPHLEDRPLTMRRMPYGATARTSTRRTRRRTRPTGCRSSRSRRRRGVASSAS